MTTSSPALHFYKFDLQSPTQGGKSTITSPLKAPNGPAVYTHTAILNFNGLEAAKNLVVEMTAKARTVAVAVMRSGKAFYLGAVNGLDLTDGAWEGGVKGEDFSGYTVTLMGEEAKFPYEFDTALLVAPKFP